VIVLIEIVTIGKVPRRLLSDLAPKLVEIYAPLVEDCLFGAELEMPPAAYDSRRKQYRPDIILERVQHRITGENRVLAITDVDLYVPALNFIFGQAQYPGRVALISLCRLDPAFYGKPSSYEVLLGRTTKEAIHELGHTFGLAHCPKPSCVMSFSNNIREVDKKLPAFCNVCRRKLRR
jgi:archaemetzincin